MNETAILLIYSIGIIGAIGVITFHISKWYHSKKYKKICKHCGSIGLYDHHKNCILNKNFN